jgi:uncharacterized protein (DUF488 family)
MTAERSTGIVGVGYEGRAIGEFAEDLVKQGIDRLVDVRLTPISRKPGFSKSALREALAQVGVAYEHRAELGNPKSNRAGFGGDDQARQVARDMFAEVLRHHDAQAAISALAASSERERVAVLCFEADQGRCHRDVVLAEVARLTAPSAGSTRQAR